MSGASEAVDLFRRGYACSQAILMVYGTPLGLDRTHAAKIASGFSGGMRMGETCGAVTGAFMVLGLRHCKGGAEASTDRSQVYAAVREFVSRFEERNGSVVCKDLLGCDISTPDGMAAAKKQGLFETKCPKMVEGAAEILEEMLRDG